MFSILSKYKTSRLLTLNSILNRFEKVSIAELKEYNTELLKKAKRSDFIPYDNKNNFIKDHKPLFKNWIVCNETSDVKTKVAKLQVKGKTYRIYFQTKEGTVVVSEQHVFDNCSYNDLAIFFENNLVVNN